MFLSRSTLLNTVAALLFVGLLCSCGTPLRIPVNFEVELASDLNNDRPLRVDMVVVCQNAREEGLSRMNAKTWFETGKRQYQELAKGDPDIQMVSWEWVPGQDLAHGIDLETHRSCKTFVFADYALAGIHEATLVGNRRYRLSFGKNGLTIAPFKKEFKFLHRQKSEAGSSEPVVKRGTSK